MGNLFFFAHPNKTDKNDAKDIQAIIEATEPDVANVEADPANIEVEPANIAVEPANIALDPANITADVDPKTAIKPVNSEIMEEKVTVIQTVDELRNIAILAPYGVVMGVTPKKKNGIKRTRSEFEESDNNLNDNIVKKRRYK